MNRKALISRIIEKENFICVGLDPDLDKIPKHLLDYEDPIFEFCKIIIENTKDTAIAYKPNLAFFECHGTKGWQSLEKVMNIMPKDVFTIADAKRGDIGNTSKMYAKCFFEYFNFDAVTVAPYMGSDSIEPFLEYNGKWVIVLGLTSNKGSEDFEMLETSQGLVYEQVLKKVADMGSIENLMFVVGATKSDYLKRVREIVPNHFLLVPGVGAQGGSLEDVCKIGTNSDFGLLVNNGRSIIYASPNEDFGTEARKATLNMKENIKQFVKFT
jgi:orotidine-5'-phosphate decarboxylase